MSLPRSIDRADIGSTAVAIVATTETLVLVGPNLQTPKDMSTLICLVTWNVTLSSAVTQTDARIRLGSSTSGTQVGGTYSQSSLTSSALLNDCMMVSLFSPFTDYVQFCFTLANHNGAANSVVNYCTMLVMSF